MIEARIEALKNRIEKACLTVGRSFEDVTLLAVTKQQEVMTLKKAIAAGITQFGENYLQEALPKLSALSTQRLTWHFIGPLQRNKVRKIATHFSWVQSLERKEIADKLNEHRSSQQPPLNVCVQVNLSAQPSKAGVLPDEVEPLLVHLSNLPNLTLRGLMIFPKFTDDFSQQCAIYEEAEMLYKKLCQKGWALDTLSMGMSHDFEAAIRYGSTLVRVGQAIFGRR